MTTKTTKPHHTRILLRRPPLPATFLVFAKTILDKVTVNKTTFPTPNPTLALLTADIAAFDTAELAAQSRAKGAVETRNAKLAVVLSDLNVLRAYVQQIADADPTNAAAIAAAAGMSVPKVVTRVKSDLSAKPNKNLSGSVDVLAKVTSAREAHDWQSSIDGGKTWVDAPQTLKSKVTIGGFTPGATVSFRHRTLTKTGISDWSQPVSVLVH